MNFSFDVPADFADYAWEVIAKGYYPAARMTVSGKQYRLNFYDAVRLNQEILSELEHGGVFFEPIWWLSHLLRGKLAEHAAQQLVLSGHVASG